MNEKKFATHTAVPILKLIGTTERQCKPGEGSSLFGGTYQRRWVIPAYRRLFYIQGLFSFS
jgi:hypothetical protein